MAAYVTFMLLFSTFVDALIMGFFFNSLLHPRYKKEVAILLFCSCITGVQAVILPYTFKPVRTLVILVIMLSLNIILYKDIFIKKVFICLISMLLTVTAEIIVSPLLRYLLNVDFNEFLSTPGMMQLSVSCSLAVNALFNFATALLLKKAWYGGGMPLIIKYLAPFIISQVVFSSILMYTFYIELSTTSALIFLCFVVMFLISDIYLYKIINTISEQAQMAEQLKLFESQMNHQYDFFKAQLQSLDDIRAIRHDMKNQLQTANAMLLNGDTAAARDYLNELSDTAEAAEIPVFCMNKVVNALMFNKYLQMKHAGIQLEHSINITNDFVLGDVILCSLFANTLDNAIEACSAMADASAEKKISVKTICKGDYFVLRVENTHSNRIVLQNGMPVSSAQRHHKGYGSQILSMIAKRYNGSVEYKFDDKTFIAAVIVSMRKNEAG